LSSAMQKACNFDYSAKQRYLPDIRLYEFLVAFGHSKPIVRISILFPVGSTETRTKMGQITSKAVYEVPPS
jgi:hypothetical protein